MKISLWLGHFLLICFLLAAVFIWPAESGMIKEVVQCIQLSKYKNCILFCDECTLNSRLRQGFTLWCNKTPSEFTLYFRDPFAYLQKDSLLKSAAFPGKCLQIRQGSDMNTRFHSLLPHHREASEYKIWFCWNCRGYLDLLEQNPSVSQKRLPLWLDLAVSVQSATMSHFSFQFSWIN